MVSTGRAGSGPLLRAQVPVGESEERDGWAGLARLCPRSVPEEWVSGLAAAAQG